jgi:proteasome alpha subunit
MMMEMFAAPGGYDRAITVFSPDGRIFQVEYALETVRRGTTALGISCSEGAVLAVEEKPTSRLQDPSFVQKLFQIDDHLGAAIAGLSADARILVDQARVYAQSNRLMYDEPIGIEGLSKRVCDIKQMYTQHAGVRPFGVSMILTGVDDSGSKLFVTDPSGAYWGYKAAAIGAGADAAREVLEAEYKSEMSLDQAIVLALSCLTKVVEGTIDPSKVRIAVIPATTQEFRMLTEQEEKDYIKMLDADKAAGR